MKRLFSLTITLLMVLGTYAPVDAVNLELKTGCVIVIIGGKVAVSMDVPKISGKTMGQKRVIIHDDTGKTVLDQVFFDEVLTLSTQGLPAGTYAVILIVRNQSKQETVCW